MPRLKERLPKLCKNKNGKYEYAVVRYGGEKIPLGKWGTAEAKKAYAKFITELQNNPQFDVVQSTPDSSGSREGLMSELAALYLDHLKESNIHVAHYDHMSIILQDFLLPLYPDLPADSFSPKTLKAVRSNMIASQRYCRKVINDYIRRIVAMFSYGVEEELVDVKTVHALREVKTLRKGAKGTFDHPKRKPVPDEVVRRTLPYMTPTVAATTLPKLVVPYARRHAKIAPNKFFFL